MGKHNHNHNRRRITELESIVEKLEAKVAALEARPIITTQAWLPGAMPNTPTIAPMPNVYPGNVGINPSWCPFCHVPNCGKTHIWCGVDATSKSL